MSLKLDSYESNSMPPLASPLNKNSLLSPLSKKSLPGKMFKRMWSSLSINSDDDDLDNNSRCSSNPNSCKGSVIKEMWNEDDDDLSVQSLHISHVAPIPFSFTSSSGSPPKPEPLNTDCGEVKFRHRNSIPLSPTDGYFSQTPTFFLRRHSDAQKSLNSISE